jgi:hypothetical protein
MTAIMMEKSIIFVSSGLNLEKSDISGSGSKKRSKISNFKFFRDLVQEYQFLEHPESLD